MAKKNKTNETEASVSDFIAAVKDKKKSNDCAAIIDLIAKQTKFEPKMWGPSIIGFGSYHYKYESGHEGSAPLVGLSPRANAISLYLYGGNEREELLKKLGKHKGGKGCIYIQKLEDIDIKILKQLVKNSIKHIQSKYPG